MLIDFFYKLKQFRIPVSIQELLVLLDAMQKQLAFGSMDEFYQISKLCLVKDEKYFDRFARHLENIMKASKPNITYPDNNL